MSTRIRIAAAMLAIAGALTSCTVGDLNTKGLDTGVAGNAPAGAPAETETATPAEPEPLIEEPAAAPGPAAPDGPGTASAPDGFTPGQPIPDSELVGSPTAAHMRFIAARLDAVLANGVPADWASAIDGVPVEGQDCWFHIAVIYTQAEEDAWNNDIRTPYMCHPDGSYELSGWSESGADPKYTDFNTSLEYESGKGFVTG